jgi:hypothetical protein
MRLPAGAYRSIRLGKNILSRYQKPKFRQKDGESGRSSFKLDPTVAMMNPQHKKGAGFFIQPLRV